VGERVHGDDLTRRCALRQARIIPIDRRFRAARDVRARRTKVRALSRSTPPVAPTLPPTLAPTERLVLVARHGQTDWNLHGRWQGHTDVPLNDAGRDQARALGESLRGTRIARVVSSDLSRALETARIVAAAIDAPLDPPDPDLRERGFGVFEGLTREECAAQHPDAWARWSEDLRAVPHGAEDQAHLAIRMTRGVLHAAARTDASDAGAVLVVSHGGAIRALIAGIGGGPVPPVPNAAVYRLVFHVEAATLRVLRPTA
jgi:broad specificity phosphatase PhoE